MTDWIGSNRPAILGVSQANLAWVQQSPSWSFSWLWPNLTLVCPPSPRPGKTSPLFTYSYALYSRQPFVGHSHPPRKGPSPAEACHLGRSIPYPPLSTLRTSPCSPGTATCLCAPPRRAPFMGDPISWKLAPAVRAQHFLEQNLASSFISKDTVKFTRARLHTLQRTGIDHSPTASL